MMTLSEIEKHIMITSVPDVNTICQPLKEYFDVDIFGYQRSFLSENAVAALCNNTDIVLMSYQNNICHQYSEDEWNRAVDITTQIHTAKGGYYIAEIFDPVGMCELREKYQIQHMLTKIVKIAADVYDYYAFATKAKAPNILNYLLCNIDLLDKFIDYFRYKANPLLNASYRAKIIMPTSSWKINEKIIEQDPDCIQQEFLQSIQTSHDILQDNLGNDVQVPIREMSCLRLLGQGRSAKEIGQILKISPRTVETNWKRSRIRLGCCTRKELLDILNRN
jgi:DNA-binding CsgD family transcriptional regulator